MRYRWVIVLCAAGLLSQWVGCGQSNTKAQQAQADLDDAVAIVEAAQRGFVESSQGTAQIDTLTAFRQKKLDEALQKLQGVLSKGTPAQQQAAQALRVQITSSAARAGARTAADTYAALADDLAALEPRLKAINEMARQAQQLEGNDAPLIAQLEDYHQQQIAEQTALQTQLTTDQARLSSLKEDRAQLQQQMDELFQKSHNLRQQAMLAKGEAQFELEKQSIETDQQLNALSLRSDKLTVEIEQLEEDIALARVRLENIGKTITEMKAQILAAQERNAAAAAELSTLQERLAAENTALADRVDAIIARYENDVMATLTEAEENVANVMAQASKGSAELSLMLDRAYVLTAKLQAANIIGVRVKHLLENGEGLTSDTRDRLQAVYDKLQSQQSDAMQDLAPILDAESGAVKLANDLAGSTNADQATEKLTAMVQRLQQLEERAQAAMLP